MSAESTLSGVRVAVTGAKRSNSAVVLALQIAVLATVLGAWQILADSDPKFFLHLDTFYFSRPSDIAAPFCSLTPAR